VTIPTNFDVADDAKTKFGSFYAALFDKTLEKNPKAIVTEYSWDAGSCDPCPGPALDQNDFNALGADVITGKTESRSGSWVLSRMHARYNKDTLGQDIVFRAAPAIAGGREWRGNGGKLEHGAQSSPVNNFQGRYAIRHAWTGPIACPNPVRGIWGGPVSSDPSFGNMRGAPPPPPAPATKLAYAPRGGVQLATMIRSDVPELDLKATNAPAASMSAAPSATQPTNDAGSDAMPPPTMMPEQPKGGGCAGCASTSSDTDAAGAAALLIGSVVIAIARRRRSY
jgi:hypothetical protein